MANSCHNRLAISGDPRDVQDLVKLVEGETLFDFEKALPLPDQPGGEVSREAIRSWGVKWNASSVRRRGYGRTGRVQYRFSTPYGPPSGVLDELSRRFPDVHIELRYEVEMMEGGAATWHGGARRHLEGEALTW